MILVRQYLNLCFSIWSRYVVFYFICFFFVEWCREWLLVGVLNLVFLFIFLVFQGLENINLSFYFVVKDILFMMNDVKCLFLLVKVYKSYKKEDVMEILNKVIDKQI